MENINNFMSFSWTHTYLSEKEKMNTKAITFFWLLQAGICLHYGTCTLLQKDKSPCLIFNHMYSDVTLYCKKNATLAQIKSGLNDVKDLGDITVELYQVKLGTLPSNFFEGYNIKVLTIALCKLDGLSGGGGKPLQGLENSLERLVITDSLFHGNDFKNSGLSHLLKLREVELESNSLGEIGNDWFKNPPPSLSGITLSENKIDVIGDRVFSEISTLELVIISESKFGSIKRSMFPDPAKNLKILQITSNELTNIPEAFFTNMHRLKMVSFAGNSITRLPENIWKPIWKQLSDIDLSENPLRCDSHMDWMKDEETCAKISAECVFPEDVYEKLPPQIKQGNCN